MWKVLNVKVSVFSKTILTEFHKEDGYAREMYAVLFYSLLQLY